MHYVHRVNGINKLDWIETLIIKLFYAPIAFVHLIK